MKIRLSTFLATSSALVIADLSAVAGISIPLVGKEGNTGIEGGDRVGKGLGKGGALRIARKAPGGRTDRKGTGGLTGQKGTRGLTGRKSTRCIKAKAAPKAPRDANEMDMESPQNAIQVKVLPPSGGKRIYEQLNEVDDCVHQALANMAKYD